MFCQNCGAQINDGSQICPICGASQTEAKAAPAAEKPAKSPTAILVLGIIAIATSGYGIPGIILGAIARKKAKAWVAEGYPLTGAAKVGSILGLIGLIIGIVMTVLWPIIFIGYGALFYLMSTYEEASAMLLSLL